MTAEHMLRAWGSMEDVSEEPISDRARRWAETMVGYEGSSDDVTVAHRNSSAALGHVDAQADSGGSALRQREEQLDTLLVPGATGVTAQDIGLLKKSRMSSAPALSAIEIESCTPAPFAGWLERRRSSSSPMTTCARAYPRPGSRAGRHRYRTTARA